MYLYNVAYNPVAISLGSFNIYWYAIFIITGALVAYGISQYFMKKAGHSKDVFEAFFFLAVPVGILGGRLWYALSNLDTYINHHDGIISMFYVWEGGLAIQGALIAGAIFGYFYFRKYYPQFKFFYLADMSVPNILIAQAIGRWGNFFNREVYGNCIDASKLWFIPNFILYNMRGDISDHPNSLGGGPSCQIGEVAQPLFLYESLLNIIGFILITFILRKFWTKGRRSGDLACCYAIWYGTVRVFLEPLRDSSYIMEIVSGVQTSIVMSILFILAGIAGMVFLRKDLFFKKFQIESEGKHDR